MRSLSLLPMPGQEGSCHQVRLVHLQHSRQLPLVPTSCLQLHSAPALSTHSMPLCNIQSSYAAEFLAGVVVGLTAGPLYGTGEALSAECM